MITLDTLNCIDIISCFTVPYLTLVALVTDITTLTKLLISDLVLTPTNLILVTARLYPYIVATLTIISGTHIIPNL